MSFLQTANAIIPPKRQEGNTITTNHQHLTRQSDLKMTAVCWKVRARTLHIHWSFLAWRSAMIMAARRGNSLDGWSCFNLRVADPCDLVRRCPGSGWLTRLPTGTAHGGERSTPLMQRRAVGRERWGGELTLKAKIQEENKQQQRDAGYTRVRNETCR